MHCIDICYNKRPTDKWIRARRVTVIRMIRTMWFFHDDASFFEIISAGFCPIQVHINGAFFFMHISGNIHPHIGLVTPCKRRMFQPLVVTWSPFTLKLITFSPVTEDASPDFFSELSALLVLLLLQLTKSKAIVHKRHIFFIHLISIKVQRIWLYQL